MINKPSFIIVGVARCGTTSLYHYLKQHPHIDFPKIKEPKYFSSKVQSYPHNGPGDKEVDDNVVKIEKSYDELFLSLNKVKVIGEASSDYFYNHKKIIPLIKEKLGDVKIIICLRNPIERAFSAYNNLLRDSREKLSFYEGLMKENERIENNYDWMWHYTNGGFYSDGITNFKNHFKDVELVFFDDLIKSPEKVVQRIFTFLNVDSSYKVDLSKKYSVSGKPKNLIFKTLSSRIGFFSDFRKIIIRLVPRKYLEIFASYMFKKNNIDEKSRKFLKSIFYKEIQLVSKLTNRNLINWK